MRVLWITANFFPLLGGLEVYTEQAVASLANLCEVGLITEEGQRPSAPLQIGHVTVRRLGAPENRMRWQDAVQRLRFEVARFEPEVVHFANAGVAVYREAIPQGIPVFVTVHGNDLTAPWQRVPGEDVRARIAAALADCAGIIAVSSHTAALVERLRVKAPVTVITAGCDTSVFRPMTDMDGAVREELGIVDEYPIVLTVGRLAARKGHQHILAALRRLETRVHWVVVGEGPMRDALARSIEDSGIAERVTLAGKVSSAALVRLYNACRFFVLTPEERRTGAYLDSEGFGLVFQEAGACGKAVIASETAGCCDAVIGGATGLLVKPGDVGGLADAMRTLLADEDYLRELGENALRFVRACGGWERFAQQTVELYREAILQTTFRGR